jgi:hypothetical protein
MYTTFNNNEQARKEDVGGNGTYWKFLFSGIAEEKVADDKVCALHKLIRKKKSPVFCFFILHSSFLVFVLMM